MSRINPLLLPGRERTYTLNLLAPVIVLAMALLATGVVPLTGLTVVLAILLSHAELNLRWTR